MCDMRYVLFLGIDDEALKEGDNEGRKECVKLGRRVG